MNKKKNNTDNIQYLLDRQAIIDGFNRASKSYDGAAILQREVASRLLERLEWIKIEPKVIVDLGAGTGDVAIKLAQKYPQAKIYMVDIAEQMLHIARAKNNSIEQSQYNLFKKIKAKISKQKSQQINYICADAQHIPLLNYKVDLVISNLAIQWCENTQQLFNELQRILTSSGCLLFSSFGVDTLMELKQSWSSVSSSVHVNNFIDMHELGDAMLTSGLDDPVMDSETIVMEYSKLMNLFKDLKQIGAQNHLQQRAKGLTAKSKFKNMQQSYQQFRLDNGKYPASYEVVYGHAWGKDLTKGIKRGIKKMKINSTARPIHFVKT